MTGHANSNCYAREFCDCSRETSREHYVSRAVQAVVSGDQRAVMVRGLAFQSAGEVRTIPIQGLASRILCTRHNSALSDFDAVGEQFALALRRMRNAEYEPPTGADAMLVDGDLLERWALKTLIGCLYSGVLQKHGTNSMKGHLPPREWLDYLYSGTPLSGGQGLYLKPWPPRSGPDGRLSTFGMGLLRAERSAHPDTQVVWGASMNILGFRLTLKLRRGVNDHPAGLTQSHFRPAGIRAVGNPIAVGLEWAEGPSAPEMIVIGSRLPNAGG